MSALYRSVWAGMALALVIGGSASAQTTATAPASGDAQAAAQALVAAMARPEPSAQEKKDLQLLAQAMRDFQSKGYPALAKYVPDMTKALDASLTATVTDPDIYFTMGAATGAYYVETHDNEKALAALDKALKYDATNPNALGEKAVALAGMRRFEEAVAAYDAGIAGGQGGALAQARLHRGRGVVLIDLKRLDDAEAALKQSLVLQPNHPLALNELKYIAEIRAGGRDDRPMAPPVTVEEAAKLPVN